MIKHIPFFSMLLKEQATTNEVLLYGLLESLAQEEGFCYASNEYMAEQLGLAKGTIKNLLSYLSKRGWVTVESEGNKRIAITPLLGLMASTRKRHARMTPCGKVCVKVCEKVVEKVQERHARMTVPSR